MKKHLLIAAAFAATAFSSVAAPISHDLGAYTLTYDDSQTFGNYSSSFTSGGGLSGFAWTVPAIVAVDGFEADQTVTFALPAFTVTANAGYTLSGDFTGFLGNLVYSEFGSGTTMATGSISLVLDGGPLLTLTDEALDKVQTYSNGSGTVRSGYYAANITLPWASFNTLSVSDASITLTASGFASITSQPQNKVEFSLIATPVPEPESAAMLLAGLLAMGTIVRRRLK